MTSWDPSVVFSLEMGMMGIANMLFVPFMTNQILPCPEKRGSAVYIYIYLIYLYIYTSIYLYIYISIYLYIYISLGSRFTMAIENNMVTRNLADLGEPHDFGNRKVSKTSPEDNRTPTAHVSPFFQGRWIGKLWM